MEVFFKTLRVGLTSRVKMQNEMMQNETMQNTCHALHGHRLPISGGPIPLVDVLSDFARPKVHILAESQKTGLAFSDSSPSPMALYLRRFDFCS
jgi:hypothetical protein